MADDVGFGAKVRALHESLGRSGLPYAFGGAIALTFAVIEPRNTVDIDLNIFVGTDQVDAVVSALPPEVEVTKERRALLERDGKVRLRWGITPVDIFLATDEFYRGVATRTDVRPLGELHIPVLDPADLAVFKTFFARPKDFVDIANMVEARAFDVSNVRATIVDLLGEDANELRQFDAAVVDGRNPDRHEPRRRFPPRTS